jgi:hypothetical protein
MIVWFQRRLWMMWRRFAKELLVVVYHLLNVSLGWDAQLVSIISVKWHAKMVFNLPSTLKLEVVLGRLIQMFRESCGSLDHASSDTRVLLL